MLVTGLQGVDNSQDFSGVSTSGGRVRQDQSDLLRWVNDEDRSDGELDTLVVNVGGILEVNHVVLQGNLSFRVSNDWEGQLGAGDLINVLDPGLVGFGTVGRQTNQLDTSLGEFGFQLGESTQFSGADRSEVIRVREQHNPVFTNEFVEQDRTVGGLSSEVGGSGAQSQGAASRGQGHG